MSRRNPLVSPSELFARLGASELRIVDVRWTLGAPGRGRQAYDAGHIPGAIFLDLDTDLVAAEGPGRHPLPSPVAFRATLEAAGIGNEHEVVAYDDVGGWVAARLWWMLDNLGHEQVSVLDGGYPAWVAEGHPVTAEVPPPAAVAARLDLAESWTNVIDLDGVVDGLGDFVLLDARGGPRYRGETEPIDPLPGHIPTARSAPTDGNLGADGHLLSADALAERFRGFGADGSSGPVVTSCGSGVSACFNSLAMRVAGLPDPILYPGSYSDWSRAGLPVATGTEPGAVPVDLRGGRRTPKQREALGATDPGAALADAQPRPGLAESGGRPAEADPVQAEGHQAQAKPAQAEADPVRAEAHTTPSPGR